MLTSILSALHEGVYTLGDVQGDLAMLFEKQYTLTPVSYTHLDVYKRQALIGYIWQEAPEEEMNFTTLLEMINASDCLLYTSRCV